MVSFTHILQGYFDNTVVVIAQVPVKNPGLCG